MKNWSVVALSAPSARRRDLREAADAAVGRQQVLGRPDVARRVGRHGVGVGLGRQAVRQHVTLGAASSGRRRGRTPPGSAASLVALRLGAKDALRRHERGEDDEKGEAPQMRHALSLTGDVECIGSGARAHRRRPWPRADLHGAAGRRPAPATLRGSAPAAWNLRHDGGHLAPTWPRCHRRWRRRRG